MGIELTEEEVQAQGLPVRSLPKAEISSKSMTMENFVIFSAICAFFLIGMTVVVKKFLNLKKGQEESKAVKSDEVEDEENVVMEQV